MCESLLFLPPYHDFRAKYPVVDPVYAGPQSIVTATAFPADYSWNMTILRKCWALADLGFAVVNLDGPGTPYRSKTFHDAAYGRMGVWARPTVCRTMSRPSRRPAGTARARTSAGSGSTATRATAS